VAQGVETDGRHGGTKNVTGREAAARCGWAGENPLMVDYHDTEWGVPVHDDERLYEFLTLEGAQAGLNWQIILNKRENYRKAFKGFDFRAVARFNSRSTERLLRNTGIVRNRMKIESAITNARMILKIAEEYGSLDAYLWRFTGGKTLRNRWKSFRDIPAQTEESLSMSRDLKKRGFGFVGPTICYAFMQAVGMVNDHEEGCFRYCRPGPPRRR
jgi:DNA-3-methyladenine glycosylase I